MLEVVYVKK